MPGQSKSPWYRRSLPAPTSCSSNAITTTAGWPWVHTMARRLARKGVPPQRLRVIPNWVDTGALVIIAQKAEGKKNNVREEADAKHREELAGTQTELLQKNTALTEQIHTLTENMNTLAKEVHAATCHR